MNQQTIFQGLAQSIPDGVAIFDKNHRMVFVNQPYCTMWNETAERLQTMSRQDLYNLKLSQLFNPELDAHVLQISDVSATLQQKSHFKLKDARWFERLVYAHQVEGQLFGYVIQWRDVTVSYGDLSTAHHERDMLHSMMDNVPDQMFFKDLDSRFIRINSSMASRLGLNEPSEAVGKSDADFYAVAHAQTTRSEELQIMATGMPSLNQVHHETWADGRDSWNVSMKMPLLDSKGMVIGTYGIAHDITEQKQAEATIWKQANFDALTNLPNRRLLRDRWEQAVNGHRRSGRSLALLLLDLDHFKEVNDTLGHAVGDTLLVQASERISACLRSTDTLARMGGDEFAIILTDMGDGSMAGQLAQEIVDCLCQPFLLEGQQTLISGSIGISSYPQDGDNIDELMKQADQAMYNAKARGRNGYSIFTSELQTKTKVGASLAHDLRQALQREQFHLVYQPIVDFRSGRIEKAEVLLRWEHPELGLVPPLRFIPLAESTGLIVDIGEWVFRTAAQQVKQWRLSGMDNFQVSLNMSPLQFQRDRGSSESWGHYLRTLELDADAIVVEITEGLLMDASQKVMGRFDQLREWGLKVSLDDFGTGYSSLSYLQRFDIDYIKIDQSFMKDLSEGSKNFTLCNAIIRLSHELGKYVIAEGVETQSQLTMLRDAGCDFGQGYFFLQPCAAPEFIQFARDFNSGGNVMKL